MTRIRAHISSVRLASVLLAGIAIAPISLQSAALAQTPLTKATITQLRNRVRLKPKNAKLRKAKARDILIPGDQVATGRAAFAEFRFNEGTLARMGERAIFRFIPRSRDFVLKKGTVVLLIPPGRGKTRVRTPNVRTGISGSALFIRHDPASNTTLVGALTDSGIEVSDLEGGPSQVLKAGQMVVSVDGDIAGLYDFDLQTFFESSPLTEGILQGEAGSDKVLAEIKAGLKAQGNFATASSSPVMETPSFVKLSEADAGTAESDGPLGTEAGLEPSPLESLASQDSNIFPGRSLGISVEADSPETVIPPTSKPPEAEIPDVAVPEPEQPDPTLPDQEIPDPDVLDQDITDRDDQEIPDQDITDQEIPDQDIPDQEIPDQDIPDQDIPDQDITDQEIPDQDITDQEIPDQDITDQEIPDQDITDQEIPDQDIPDQEIPDQDITDQDLTDQEDIPDQDTIDQDVPDQEIPDQAADPRADDGFPGQGNGVENGFPGGNDEANNQALEATAPLDDVPTTEVDN